ncbi:hypothetical protein PC123_g28918 [Phytophthora cactorum]|nr:hypothetical protein PC123_g28918 [Phytophthora cactorum]
MTTRLALAMTALTFFNGYALAQGPRGPVRMGPMGLGREQFGAGNGNGFGGGMGGMGGGANGFGGGMGGFGGAAGAAGLGQWL